MVIEAETLVIVMGLVVFGVGYNAFVAYLERQPGGHEGFTGLLVVVGVAVTVLMLWPLIGAEAVCRLMVGFAASGAPMVAGSVRRYMHKRAQEIEELQRLTSEFSDDKA
jgi:hypothetical protein